MSQPSPPSDVGVFNSELPLPQSQPERLAAIARMRGMDPADVESASILEIGCGSGANLLPLAERYPGSRFLGVDRSAEAIANAAQIAATVGLRNVEFRQQDSWNFGEPGSFDYILAPDVYSWVDSDSRDQFLSACREQLSPAGLAYVNTNLYPGWRAHELLRSIMQFQTRGARTDAERLAAARTLLAFVESTLPADDGGYGAMMHELLAPIRLQPDRALLHDYLGEAGYAAYFTQFAAHVRQHGLQVVGDAGLGIRPYDYLPPPQERMLRELTADLDEQLQLRDILQNKSHRQALLARDQIALQVELDATRLAGTFLEARLQPEEPEQPIESTRDAKFVGPDGLSIVTAVPAAKAALVHLGSIWPNRIAFDELLEVARARIEAAGTEPPRGKSIDKTVDVARLTETLLHCCVPGIVQVHSTRQSFVSTPGERPTASPLARWQAAREEVTTNRRHEPVLPEPLDRYSMVRSVGTRTVADAIEHLTTAAAEGQIALVEQGEPVAQDQSAAFAEREMTATLARLAEHALLIA